MNVKHSLAGLDRKEKKKVTGRGYSKWRGFSKCTGYRGKPIREKLKIPEIEDN